LSRLLRAQQDDLAGALQVITRDLVRAGAATLDGDVLCNA